MSSVASPRAIDALSRSARGPWPSVADEIVKGGRSRLPNECERARRLGVSRPTTGEAPRALVATAP